MANQIEYIEDTDLDAALETILTEEPSFERIHDEVKFAACVLSRVDDSPNATDPVPGDGDPVQLKKVHPAMRLFMKKDPDFLLIVDAAYWKEYTAETNRAQIVRVLTRISVETTPKGVKKIKLLPYEIVTTMAAVRLCGVYDEKMKALSEALDVWRKQALGATAKALQSTVKTSKVVAKPEPAKPEPEPVKPAVKAAVKPTSKKVEPEESYAAPPEEEEDAEEKPRVRVITPVAPKVAAVAAKVAALKEPAKRTKEPEPPAVEDADADQEKAAPVVMRRSRRAPAEVNEEQPEVADA